MSKENARTINAHVSAEHKASFYVTSSRSFCDASMSRLSGRLGKPMSAEFSPSGKLSGKLCGEGLLCGRGWVALLGCWLDEEQLK